MSKVKIELFCKTHNTWLETYWDCIQKGFIDLYNIKTKQFEKVPLIVGRDIRTEISKLINDLKDERFYYDTTESEKRIHFKENLCFQGKAPFYMKPISLMMHQKVFWEVLYSFKMKSTGYCRFTKSLLLVARKNGKSTDMASDANYDLFLGAGGQDIVCCSNDDNTAKLIWKEIAGMRQRLDIQNEITKHNLVEIRNDKKNITIFRMSEKTQSKDGRNIDKCYYDECHDSKTTDIADACWQSMSVKNEKFFIQLTTEGVLNDMYLDHELEYARGVLYDEIDDIHYLPFLFTQDSDTEIFQDKWTWCKSNPSLIYGVKKWSFIEDQMTKAKHQKSAMVTMLCKDFNIKQNSANSWLMNSDVEYVQDEARLEEFKNCFCFAGVDLAATTDLSSVKILMMKPHNPKKYIFSKYFIPEIKIDSDKEGGAKYREWAQKGYVEVHEGNQVNLQKIVEWFKWLGINYGIKVYKLGYDQRFATDFLSGMEQIGYGNKKGEVCEMVYQSRSVMSNPMKIVEAELKSQNIHGLTEMDIWCLLNTAIDVDGREMIMPIKMKADRKIDGTLSLIMAYAMFDRYKSDYIKYVNGEG